MKTTRLYAAALLGALTVTAIAPVMAQTNAPKPSKQERQAMTKSQRAERKAVRKMEKNDMTTNTMSGNTMTTDAMAPTMMNNTAVVQGGIDRANQTLNNMVALLNQIDARHRGGAATTTTTTTTQ